MEVKYRGPGPEARIAARLRNSGDPRADVVAQHGDGPTRTITNIHHSYNHAYMRGDESPEAEVDKE